MVSSCSILDNNASSLAILLAQRDVPLDNRDDDDATDRTLALLLPAADCFDPSTAFNTVGVSRGAAEPGVLAPGVITESTWVRGLVTRYAP